MKKKAEGKGQRKTNKNLLKFNKKKENTTGIKIKKVLGRFMFGSGGIYTEQEQIRVKGARKTMENDGKRYTDLFKNNCLLLKILL